MEKITTVLNGKEISYTPSANFMVQVGKGKSEYKTQYTFTGGLQKAAFYYTGINIGNGYKKRLVMRDEGKTSVLAKQTSV